MGLDANGKNTQLYKKEPEGNFFAKIFDGSNISIPR
jgi:hypothetical protein